MTGYEGPTGAGSQTLAFAYTGAAQTFTVPADVSALAIEAYGAEGGASATTDQGGQGGGVRGLIVVVPGETLQVNVGGKPVAPIAAGSPGGFNGGGATSVDGGGGGGASDVRRAPYALADRLIVGPGGGGSGGNGVSPNPGLGDGLTPIGGTGGNGSGTSNGGAGGTQAAGGAGGTGAVVNGGAGALGVGGIGGTVNRGGGGGGGGYYGGGGGGTGGAATTGGGGGGGSGFVNGTHAFASYTGRNGHGAVNIIYPSTA